MNALEGYRKKKALTVTQLAILIGMHPSNISLVEKGHRKAWKNLRSVLARSLDVEEDLIFDESGEIKKYEGDD